MDEAVRFLQAQARLHQSSISVSVPCSPLGVDPLRLGWACRAKKAGEPNLL